MSSELRSIVDIDDRVESESFAELQRHWRLFRQRHTSLDEIDPSGVDDAIDSLGKSRGIDIFYVSNRSESQEEVTRQNLAAHGFASFAEVQALMTD